MVGGPGKTVICSAAISSAAPGGSKVGTGYMVAPAVNDATTPALDPNVWNSGLTRR
jgi:hypothetical protein